MAKRRAMLTDLCIGECLINQGRFLDPILDVAWAICEESSWAYPAHQFDLTDIHRPYVDLGAAMTALDLAEMDALVGSALDPALHKRIHDELTMNHFGKNNGAKDKSQDHRDGVVCTPTSDD